MLNSRTPNLEQTIDLMLSEVRKSCFEGWVMPCLANPRFDRDSYYAGIDDAIETCSFVFKGLAAHLHAMKAQDDANRPNREHAA